MPKRLILLAALAAAGCGGSGDDAPSAQTSTQPAPPPSQTTTGATTTSEGESAAGRSTAQIVAPQKRRLERAGLEPRDSGVGGVDGAKGALELPLRGGGDLTVIVFDTRRAAEEHAGRFREMAERYPDHFRVEIRDTTLYLGVAEDPEKLTRTGFADAVEAAGSSD